MPGVNGSTQTYIMRWRQLKDPDTGESILTDPTAELRPIGDRVNKASCQLVPSLFNSPEAYCGGDDDHRIMAGGGFNPLVLHQVVLPDGRAYTFTYNVYGEIDKIVYPTGGYERFVHGIVGTIDSEFGAPTVMDYKQGNRGVTTRRRAADMSPDKRRLRTDYARLKP